MSSVLKNIFKRLNLNSDFRSITPLSGGDINDAFAVTLNTGEKFFVKTNAQCPEDFFETEAENLQALRQALGGEWVPEVIGFGGKSQATLAFLVLEYLEPGVPHPQSFEELGRTLAGLHRVTHSRFGWHRDNYIGRTPQKNEWRENWNSFFLEQRLEPQFRWASEKKLFSKQDLKKILKFLEALPQKLESLGNVLPSLCHGDLWGGNVHCALGGKCYLIDAACHYGHRETDLAMTRLFGGFPDSFYRAYQEAWPLEDGFASRLELWNLYPLLNHLNLFGRSYLASVLRIVEGGG